ncbi:hypothetical protein [Marinobacter algicola]|nr:hypothetical protein [Marinobacter algicola]
MARNTTGKTLHYLRAVYDGNPFDLGTLMIASCIELNTPGSREIEFGGGDIVRIERSRNIKGGAILVQLTRFVPGEKAPTLQPHADSANDAEESQAPPPGKEFKDGDSFFLVSQHDVIFCSHGISKAKSNLYLQKFFVQAGFEEKVAYFDLNPAAKLDKLKLIKKHGVRSMELGASAFDLSMPKHEQKNWFTGAMSTAWSEIEAVIAKDESMEDQKYREDLLVNVEVRLDGNSYASQGAKNSMEHLAEWLLEDPEAPLSEFKIITRDNEAISSSDIRLQTRVKVQKQERSVEHNDMWSKMEVYFSDLKKQGLLEQ